MNKQTKREGFVDDAKPVAAPVPDAIEHQPAPEPETLDDTPTEQLWPITVKLLHKSVRNNKGEFVKELTFREPTGGDINRYGNPCHVNQEGEVIILDKKMITMMAALSGILQPFLENMDPRDYNSCAYRLRGFFLPDPAAW